MKTFRHLVERLEPRQFLAADLTASFLTSPAAALAGTSQAVTLSVANTGDARAKGSMTVAYYAALDGDPFDPGTATLLKRATRSVTINAGATLSVTDTLPISVALPAGSYRIYAVIDADGKIAEGNESNNTAQSPTLAIAQPDYDLIPSFASSAALPPSILVGKDYNATLRVTIENSSGGSAALPSSLRVLIEIAARPSGVNDDSQDVLLNRSVVNAGTGALGPGQSRTFSVNIQFPDTLPAGDYEIIAKVDSGDALAETDETNNEAEFFHAVKVTAPFSDPALAFSAGTVLPISVVADGRALPLKLDITNLGNTKIPGGQTSSITIVAHNINTSAETTLGVFTVSLTNLAAAKSKTFSLSPTIPLGLPDGDYEIRAALSTTAAGDFVANNSESTVTTFNVGPAFCNLETQAPVSNFNPALLPSIATSGSVHVPIKNLSNTLLPSGTAVNIAVTLRLANATSSADDILIGTASNVSISGLAIGATKTVRVSSRIPARLPSNDPVPNGEYEFVATVTPVSLVESNASDNTAAGASLIIGAPFIDLAVVSAGQNYRTPAATGSGGIGTVVLRNMSNIPVQGTVNIQFFAQPQGSSVAVPIGNRAFQINLSPGAVSPTLSSALTLNIASGTLVDIFARIDPASFSDADLLNSQLYAGTVVVSSQYVDLGIASATNPFSGTLAAGATGNAQALLVNYGSGTAAGDVTVNYYATVSGALDGSEILIGGETFTVGLGPARLTPSLTIPLILPTPLSPTTYKIRAQIVASPVIDNNQNNNLSPILGTVTVNP
jgi:hypothetical protein